MIHIISTLIMFIILNSLSMFSGISNASQYCNNNTTYAPNQVVYTITVSQSGEGNFSKIQSAIESIPSGNNQWIRIYVNPGSYWEKVRIPYDKQCIVLEGHSNEDTEIVNNGHDRTDTSSTFISSADNFVAKKITFKNVYNSPGKRQKSSEKVVPAVAATIHGDKSAFYWCHFIGYQDTLWDSSGRHYFKSCYIEGAVDFIWGSGQSYYEDCHVYVVGDGFITAHARINTTDPSGFVFDRGFVYGRARAYLGRAYNQYSRVIYQNIIFTNVINPLGWDAWNCAGHVSQLTYAEVNCKGRGANKSKRVSWEKTIEGSELSKYTRQSFIDDDGWISLQP